MPQGVSPESWAAIGATPVNGGWHIPERDEQGFEIGRSIRLPDGSKSFVAGGHRGLTLAWPLPAYAGSSPTAPVFIVEGATDTAAGLTLGLDTVGRFSAMGGLKHLSALLKERHVCVIAENDKSGAGQAGAMKIAQGLIGICASVRIISPPPEIKDLRKWRMAGITGPEIVRRARAVEPVGGDPAAGPSDPDWSDPVALDFGPKPPEFPLLDAFPQSLAHLRDFCAALAESLQVPIELPVFSLLACAAAACAQKVEVMPRPGWTEVMSIFALVLSKSGERKSATLSAMAKPIQEWEQAEAMRLGPEIADQQERLHIATSRRDSLRVKAAKRKLTATEQEEFEQVKEFLRTEIVIRPPALWTSDATTEGLCRMLLENQERGFVMSAEADALDVMLGRYSDKGKANMGIWLKGHCGDSERIVRAGRPTEHLKRPTVSVCLLVQPESVTGMFANPQARGRGLVARFLCCAPQSRVGSRKTGSAVTPVPEELSRQYSQTIKRILDIPIEPGKGPVTVKLGPEALAMFEAFEAKVEHELRPFGDFADNLPWGSKICGAVARIALALHCLQHLGVSDPEWLGQIDGATMAAALSLAPFLMDSERLVAGIIGTDRSVVIAQRVLGWIKRTGKGEFSKRDAFTACRNGELHKADEIDPALELLEEHHYLRPITKPAPGRGRPPSDRFLVNPAFLHGSDGVQ